MAAIMLILIIVMAATCGRQKEKAKEAKGKTSYILVDSSKQRQLLSENAKFDAQADAKNKTILQLSDSIEKLNKGLKSAKIIYKDKIVRMWSDTMMTVTECKEYVDAANDVIVQQDGIITVQSVKIDSLVALNQISENKAKFNEDIATKCSKKEIDCFVELSKFKHRFWRWYHKDRK